MLTDRTHGDPQSREFPSLYHAWLYRSRRAALHRCECPIDEALALVDRAVLPKRVRQLDQDLAQCGAFTPLRESAMDRLIVGVALRRQIPLRARAQNPRRDRQDRSGGHRPALDVLQGCAPQSHSRPWLKANSPSRGKIIVSSYLHQKQGMNHNNGLILAARTRSLFNSRNIDFHQYY